MKNSYPHTICRVIYHSKAIGLQIKNRNYINPVVYKPQKKNEKKCNTTVSYEIHIEWAMTEWENSFGYPSIATGWRLSVLSYNFTKLVLLPILVYPEPFLEASS